MLIDHNSNSQDVELNLAPIIDCMTVLITFILISASFLSLGALETSIAAPGTAEKPKIQAEIKVHGESAEIILSGNKNLRKKITLDQLKGELEVIKKENPTLNEITLSPEDEASFDAVVKMVDQVKPIIGSVAFGGMQ